MSNSLNQNLRFRLTLLQAVTRDIRVTGYFVIFGLDVNGDKLAGQTWLKERT